MAITWIMISSWTARAADAPNIIASEMRVEVHEVHELIFVVYALANRPLHDSLMIQHSTAYYNEVIAAFEGYQDFPLVQRVRKQLALHYHQLRMDAANYHFNEAGQLIRNTELDHISWGRRDCLEPYLSELEELAQHMNFRSFYSRHSSYYEVLVERMHEQAVPEQQIQWLEARFPNRYNSYRVVISPLCNGLHSTNYRIGEVVIFVSAPTLDGRWSAEERESRDTRMLFTEFDHNYVNPISDLYKGSIRRALRHRSIWANGGFSEGYSSAYAVFNEYMTWAVFLLYAHDHFDAARFAEVRKHLTSFMVNDRGFPEFSWFTARLLFHYQKQKDTKNIALLIPVMIGECHAYDRNGAVALDE